MPFAALPEYAVHCSAQAVGRNSLYPEAKVPIEEFKWCQPEQVPGLN